MIKSLIPVLYLSIFLSFSTSPQYNVFFFICFIG
nr:MAG TPA: hypothetical protein [Caudoviricetes sp.]